MGVNMDLKKKRKSEQENEFRNGQTCLYSAFTANNKGPLEKSV